MNQDERRAGPGLEVAHASVGEIEANVLRKDVAAGTNLSPFSVSMGNEILAGRFLQSDTASNALGSGILAPRFCSLFAPLDLAAPRCSRRGKPRLYE